MHVTNSLLRIHCSHFDQFHGGGKWGKGEIQLVILQLLGTMTLCLSDDLKSLESAGLSLDSKLVSTWVAIPDIGSVGETCGSVGDKLRDKEGLPSKTSLSILVEMTVAEAPPLHGFGKRVPRTQGRP
ncbi:ankyrin repeat-containing protein P16F5.05c [Pyrus ussuriensis x Pyrus communis]|uniref:Ankyrin repeat-containing protein P16F5.05c n=1 Tax=Pyrus ussuriensis x Pyrus communis TaxID=2448454 RepID=A0A5N5GMZ1_9ROSA|nr:ankyrin repeat-containing protein P16F5.05c [Pyrus ussuriensis x Pyrus communis]